MIEIKNITARLRAKKLMNGRNLDIRCDAVNAISNKDILELYLFLSGVAHWRWIDVKEKSLSRQSFLLTSVNLLRDVLQWPSLYLNTLRKITSHYKVSNAKSNLSGKPSFLFLRTDHWFNIKSGGSVGHLSGVISGFRTLGYKTNVVSTDYLVNVEKDSDFHLCPPVYSIGRNIPTMPEILYNNQIASFVKNRWNELSPSFIYQRYSLGNYAGVLLKHKYSVPFICEYNGSFTWMARNWYGKRIFFEKLLDRIEMLNLRIADVVTVVSKPMKDELLKRGIEDDKILINPNCVDPELYSPNIDGSDVRKKYNLKGKLVIGFIGTFGKWHGAEVLAEAFGRIIKEFPGYREGLRLLMIGDGITVPDVKRKISQFGIEDISILPGLVPQEEGPVYMAACDIFASPHVPNSDGTPFFGSPTKLFEYMGMGKGIVASDLDQIGEVLEHDRTAWLVAPGKAEPLANGLKILINNKELRCRLGKTARREVVDGYTWKEHTQNIIDKLKERCE